MLYIHTSQYNMRLDCFTDIRDQSIHYYFTFAYIQSRIKQAWTLSIVRNILPKFVFFNTSLNNIWSRDLKGVRNSKINNKSVRL